MRSRLFDGRRSGPVEEVLPASEVVQVSHARRARKALIAFRPACIKRYALSKTI